MTAVEARPYPFTFDPATTALVIIDMQRDFVEPGGFGETLGNDVSHLQAVVPPLKKVLETARAVGLTVIHTREGHVPDLSDCPPAKLNRGDPSLRSGAPGPKGRILVRGEYGHDIVDDLAPLPGEPVIDKPGKGSFHGTSFGALLAERGITSLVVTGVTTEVCVHTTVREANDRAYECQSVPPGRRLRETVIVAVDDRTAVVSTLFGYPGAAVEGRQTQTWARLGAGWRIVAAHVSETPIR